MTKTTNALHASMQRLDDCELAGVVALGLAVLTKRQAWKMTPTRLRALAGVGKMLEHLIERRQA